MIFVETELADAWIIDPEPIEDARGSFARTFCENEFAAHRLETRFVQHSASRNAKAGTLRGMHFQKVPHQEVKLVSCIKGAIHDVIIDLRPGSPTYHQCLGVELSEENRRQLYVGKGFAHGFQTLRDDCEVLYRISGFFAPDASGGVRYDDPIFGIEWPLPVTAISDRDRKWAFVT